MSLREYKLASLKDKLEAVEERVELAEVKEKKETGKSARKDSKVKSNKK